MTCRELTGIALLCMMLISGTLYAQIESTAGEAGAHCTVTTRDGMHIEGVEIAWKSDTLILRTNDGVEARIPSSSIVAMARGTARTRQFHDAHAADNAPAGISPAKLRSMRGGPNLFLIPTAYAEGAGDVRLGLHELFFPVAAYGIAGYATIQGGASIFPDIEWMLFHATVKLTPVSGRHGAFAVGATFLSHDDGATTAPFALATVNLGGKRGTYITGGAAYQHDNGRMLALGGVDLPVSDNVRLVTELMLTNKASGLSYITPGARFQTGNFDIDVGVILPLTVDGLTFLPWVGASVVL